ncbi:MAG TPA: DUF58 domain-containing protein [Firmicutes bacterium]|nr:DUF58 domain-containing protein [Bacillota bacterium]
MLFLVILGTIVLAYFLQKFIFKKYTFSSLKYNTSLDSTEVSVGDDLYMYEELTNTKGLPLPYLKVATKLPEGLAFRLAEKKDGKYHDIFTSSVDSMFSLKGQRSIKRRWRINCKKRGVYTLGSVDIVANDLVGFNPMSQNFSVEKTKATTVTVLPSAVDLERDFKAASCISGDIITNSSLLTDPLLRGGAREYTPWDPMNKINWKLTASHGRLLVNVEEHILKIQSNIILNMCSHIIERDEEAPMNPEFIEYNITVAASLLDRFANANIPSRLIINTPPETIHSDFIADTDEIGSKILVTPPFCGRNGCLDAMRVLARLEMRYSMPIERLLDYILARPYMFTENNNIILVTAVLDNRMLVFHREMKRRGIEVIFYVTTSNRGTSQVPDDVAAFFRTSFDSYHVRS